jgi:hypothetical protein
LAFFFCLDLKITTVKVLFFMVWLKTTSLWIYKFVGFVFVPKINLLGVVYRQVNSSSDIFITSDRFTKKESYLKRERKEGIKHLAFQQTINDHSVHIVTHQKLLRVVFQMQWVWHSPYWRHSITYHPKTDLHILICPT